MTVKCRWCHICAKEELANIIPDHLEQLLPEGHCNFICKYTPLERGFTASLKLKLATREEAETWLEDFQRSSRVTLRVDKTYPMTEDKVRRNSYRVDMRCQLKTRQTAYTKRNTHCPAGLYLVLKKHCHRDNRKSRSIDTHIQEGLLLHVTIKHHHNHRLGGSESLQQGDVARETVEKLVKLFQSGHSPFSALNILKYDLQEEQEDSCVHASADRSICPDVQFCYRLYYSIFKKEYGAVSGDAMLENENLQERLEVYNKEQCETRAYFPSWSFANHMPGSEINVGFCKIGTQEQAGTTAPPTPLDGSASAGASSQSELVAECLKGRLRSMFDGLMDKLEKDHETFQAPIESLVSSYDKIHTDSDLVSALSTFGKLRSAAVRNIKMQPRKGLEMSSQRGVQPTADARRKTLLGGRRVLITGRPPKRALREYKYGKVKEGSGALPRRPAPHTIAQCVSAGVSLGGQHSKKYND
ncbi:uncharacterized protein LOC130375883 isoform X2 [Gadus chalcogrammus]|uniref:uncharacterized protein LOC130375883 isoform X2 n=1 Tax=Gadus chalcogrammus TaxID=1042646 RepID=UPI0024C4E1FE|nr:uncharacterized protein LOC130375883 isoform X2 [Gadus chalcogrammus]